MPACALRACRHPAFRAQHLEVAADGRLGKLHDRAELIDRELVSLEGKQNPAPHGVREGSHLPKEGGRAQTLNPFIRIEGYITGRRKSSSVWRGSSAYLLPDDFKAFADRIRSGSGQRLRTPSANRPGPGGVQEQI